MGMAWWGEEGSPEGRGRARWGSGVRGFDRVAVASTGAFRTRCASELAPASGLRPGAPLSHRVTRRNYLRVKRYFSGGPSGARRMAAPGDCICSVRKILVRSFSFLCCSLSGTQRRFICMGTVLLHSRDGRVKRSCSERIKYFQMDFCYLICSKYRALAPIDSRMTITFFNHPFLTPTTKYEDACQKDIFTCHFGD